MQCHKSIFSTIWPDQVLESRKETGYFCPKRTFSGRVDLSGSLSVSWNPIRQWTLMWTKHSAPVINHDWIDVQPPRRMDHRMSLQLCCWLQARCKSGGYLLLHRCFKRLPPEKSTTSPCGYLREIRIYLHQLGVAVNPVRSIHATSEAHLYNLSPTTLYIELVVHRAL